MLKLKITEYVTRVGYGVLSFSRITTCFVPSKGCAYGTCVCACDCVCVCVCVCVCGSMYPREGSVCTEYGVYEICRQHV